MYRKSYMAVFMVIAALIIAGCSAPAGDPPIDETESIVPVMVNVPAGRFQGDGFGTFLPQVSAFQISKYEITRNQFREIMGTDPSDATLSSAAMNSPVNNANWYQAIAYCNKLSLHEGLSPVYSVTGISDWAALPFSSIPTTSLAWDDAWNQVVADWGANGYRLPTEMEWKWAAMGAPTDGQNGGTNTTGYGKAFAGSTGTNSLGDYAWHVGNSGTKTQIVGNKLPNELGLYDMSGNVYEFCWDWYNVFPGNLQIDYRGSSYTGSMVVSGGCFNTDADTQEMEHREFLEPDDAAFGVGIRLARYPD